MEQNIQVSSPSGRVVSWIDSIQLLSRPYDLAAIALLTFSLALCLWRFDSFQVGSYIDDAQYTVLAQSIVQGEGYGIVNSSDKLLQAPHPVGYPLILAPVYALFGANFAVLKTVSVLFTLASVLLICKGWNYLGLPSASLGLATAALVALSPISVAYARMIMSEPAFGFLVLLTIILTVRSVRGEYFTWHSVVLGFVWMFVASVRTVGVTVIGASVFYLLLQRRWRNIALAFAGLVVALILVVLLTDIDWHDLNGIGVYVRQAGGAAKETQGVIAWNAFSWVGEGVAQYLFVHLRDSLVPLIGGPTTANLLSRIGLGFVPWIVSVLVAVSVAAGYFLNIRRNGWLPVHFYIPMSMAILILWFGRGERFLYGLLPFLFAFLLIGGQSLIQAFVSGVGKYAPLAKFASVQVSLSVQASVLGLLLISQFIGSMRIDNSLNHVSDFRIGNTWIKERAPQDAVVLSEHPEISYLYSDRMGQRLPGDPMRIREESKREASTYLLIAPALYWYPDKTSFQYSRETVRVMNALQANTLSAELVFEDSAAMVKVYRVLPPIGQSGSN